MHVQLEASAALLETEGNTRGAASTREQAAEKRALQQVAAAKVADLEAQQETLQRRSRTLDDTFQRCEARTQLQALEAEQWTAAESLLQARHSWYHFGSNYCFESLKAVTAVVPFE